MAHPRKLIRKGVTAALKQKTRARDRVSDTRVTPYRRGIDLPAISVYTLEDDVDPESIKRAPRELNRALILTIEGWIQGTNAVGENLDDELDDFEEEIQKVMHADPFFKQEDGECLTRDSIQVGTKIDIFEKGDRHIGLLRLFYEFTYDQLAPEGPTNLDDFTDVTATHNLGNDVDPGDEAVDDFVVQVIP